MSLIIFAGLVLVAAAELLVCSALCRAIEDGYYNPPPQQLSEEDGGHQAVVVNRGRGAKKDA